MPAPRSEGAPSRSVPRPGVEQSFSDFKSNWGEVPGANPKNVRSHLAPHINRMEDTIATLVGNLGELSDAGFVPEGEATMKPRGREREHNLA